MRVGPVDSTVTAAATAARVAVQPAAPATPQASAPSRDAAAGNESPDVHPETFLARGVEAGQALAMYTLKAQLANQDSMVATLMTARAEP